MSYSRQILDRLSRRKTIRRSVALIFLLVSAVYLPWRLTIFNADAPLLSAVFYLAEIIGFILFLTTVFVSWTYRHRELRPAPKDLSVDVFVLAYKEPVEVLRRTLGGALKIEYPHDTWLLDDGNRPEMRALADELGVRYIARAQNIHAKAGNINNALTHSTAEFFAVFDADHIPMPNALDVLLGFTDDPHVGMVQSPQDFYNTTSFQFMNSKGRGGVWHDQSYFYNVIQACKDTWNASSCVGTSVVYRRSAIDAIGGIPVETVTEDMHTSLRLHLHGWRTVYVNESVAYGIGAVDLAEYYKTRLRWGFGNVHALRLERILTRSGLTLKQRLSYLTLGLIYLEGWQQIIMYLVPVYSLLTGVPPFEITIFNVLMMIGFPFLGYVMLQEFGCGFGRYWLNEMFSMVRFPVYIAATFAVIRDKFLWRSSSKALRGRVNWRLMAPQLSILTLSLMALGVGIYRNVGNFELGPLGRLVFTADFEVSFFEPFAPGYNLDLLLIAGFWATFNVIRCGLFVLKVLRNVGESHADFRFRVPVALEIDFPRGRVVVAADEISMSEVKARLPAGMLPAADAGPLNARLILPAGTASARIEVLKHWPGRHHDTMEARFVWGRGKDSDKLADALYSVDWHRHLLTEHAYFRTPLEFLGRLIQWPWRRDDVPQSTMWRAAIYRFVDGGDSRLRFGLLGGPDSESPDLVVFESIQPGSVVTALEICDIEATWRRYSVADTAPDGMISRKSMAGIVPRRYRISPTSVVPLPVEQAVAAG